MAVRMQAILSASASLFPALSPRAFAHILHNLRKFTATTTTFNTNFIIKIWNIFILGNR